MGKREGTVPVEKMHVEQQHTKIKCTTSDFKGDRTAIFGHVYFRTEIFTEKYRNLTEK